MARTKPCIPPLQRERRWGRLLLSLLSLSLVSGLLVHWVPGFPIWQQWAALVHWLVGLGLSVSLVGYTAVHYRRTLANRRAGLSLSGHGLFLGLAGLVGTGLYTGFAGQIEAARWIIDSHVLLAYGTIALLVVHVLAFAWGSRSSSGTVKPGSRTLEVRLLLPLIGSLVVGAATVAGATWLYRTATPIVEHGQPVVENYEYPYGPNPFAPSETRTSTGGFIDERSIADSDTCGACHRQLFDEWASSLHGQAASDPSYVANITLLAEANGMAATRYCEGCHAPVALLTGTLSAGGTHGGTSGTASHREGVGCMGCHGIERAVHLKGVASFEYAPSDGYLFAHAKHPAAVAVRNFLIRIRPDTHRREMARPILGTPELCATCHVQFMPKSFNDWGWVKMQDEYAGWLTSPYSGHHEQEFSRDKVTACKDCHLPRVPGTDPSADEKGLVVSHRTPGSNTVIPWLNGDHVQLSAEQRFLQGNKITLSIDKPWKSDASQNADFVQQGSRQAAETPGYFYLGEQVHLSVSVTNAGVGHRFPGGTTDINEVWLALRVVDATGRLVYTSGDVGEGGHVDPTAHFYRSIPIDRHGKPVWRHDLFRMVGDSYRKTIPAGESDVVTYDFTIPAWAKSPILVTTVLRYRKFNQRYADWAIQATGLPITDLARDALAVPLRVRGELDPLTTTP